MIGIIYCGDALTVLKTMPSESVNMCVTSPPYYALRDYGVDGQIGLESTPDAYIERLVDVFREVRRVLRDDGTLWVNIGDSYAGSVKGAWDNKAGQKEVYVPDADSPQVKLPKTWQGIKPKDLIGIPWMLAFALRSDGWFLRQDIIWHKTNPMPEFVLDRCTKAHEYLFLLSKSKTYFFDTDAIKEPASYPNDNRGLRQDSRRGTSMNNVLFNTGETRHKRDVWSVSTAAYKEAHFATFPEKLIEPCISAGCPKGGIVLDCFNGAGTTGVVCAKFGREYIGIELNPEYVALSEKRITDVIQELNVQKAQMSLWEDG